MLYGSIWLTLGICLAATIVIEGVLAWLLGVRAKRGQLTVLMVNMMTNPLVVSIHLFCAMHFGRTGDIVSTVVLEAAAFLAEALLYRRDPPCGRNPFLLSGLLNAGSFLTGVLLNICIQPA